MIQGEAGTLKRRAWLTVNCRIEEEWFFSDILSEYNSERSKNVHNLHNNFINVVMRTSCNIKQRITC